MFAKLLIVSLLLPLSAQARDIAPSWPGEPGPEYFSGIYARIGRSAATDPALVDDLVRIGPGADGASLQVDACAGDAAAPKAMLLQPALDFEAKNMLAASAEDGSQHWCQYFHDANNYAIVSCSSDQGARYTLWASPDTPDESCPGL